MAVAMPIVAARPGRPRRTATAAITAALPACSGSSSATLPWAVAVQCSRTGSALMTPCHQAQPPSPRTATKSSTRAGATQRRRRRRRTAGGVALGMVEVIRGASSGVRVQSLVELDLPAGPGTGLDGPRLGVAPEEQAGRSGQLGGLDEPVRGQQPHLGAGGDVAPRLDDAVVPEADADTGVRADEAPPPDRDDVRAAAGQRAHDGRPPPAVGPMAGARPPTSLPSPTTTPAETLPSIIEAPSVPASKLTKPSTP